MERTMVNGRRLSWILASALVVLATSWLWYNQSGHASHPELSVSNVDSKTAKKSLAVNLPDLPSFTQRTFEQKAVVLPRPKFDAVADVINKESTRLKRTYRRFFETHPFGQKQQDAILSIQAQMGLLPARIDGLIASGKLSREDAASFYKNEFTRLNTELRDLLGTAANDFTEATQRDPIWQQMDVFRSISQSKGAPITAEQQEKLVDFTWVFYKQEGVDFFFNPNYSKVANGRQFLDQMQRRQNSYTLVAEAANDFLAPQQIEILKQFQQSQIQGYIRTSRLPQHP